MENLEPAYRQALSRIAVLEELSKQADSISRDGSLDSGFHALQAADFANAKAKFEEVLVAVTPQLRLASIAAYGLGLVAEDNVDWITAAKCFQLSCTYCPDENNLLKSSIYLWRAGFYEDAASVSLELRRVFAQKYGESSEQYAGVLNNLGAQFYELGRTNEAIELFEKSLHIRRKLKSDVSIDFAAGLANLGNIHVKTGHLKKALQLHRQALKVGLKAGIQNDERYSAMLNGVAETFRLNQMFRKSEIYFRRALKVDAETVGTQHPFYARDLHFYAKLLMETNRLSDVRSHGTNWLS